MNRLGLICRCVMEHPESKQRDMARELSLSLGTVNKLVNQCIEEQYLSANSGANTYELTKNGMEFMEQFRVDGALIAAAGFGSRFVPLTFEMPKGLLEVFGERMIERQIKQLHEVGIFNITIAVGYLKEKFEYLIDKYGVELLYNPEYMSKNTLTTIYRASKVFQGKNVYLLSSDNWLRENMFHTYECGAWYAGIYMEGTTSEWVLDFNKKGRIQEVKVGGNDAWVMYGPVYLSREFSEGFLPLIDQFYHTPGTEQMYWEHVLIGKFDDLEMNINCQPDGQIYEFENLEELRLFDESYQNHSNNEALELVANVFEVSESEIHNIRCLKSGMTNQSFLFELKGQHYICRIPGVGTELLINRAQEAQVYEAIDSYGFAEKLLYFNGETGYKIAKYYEGARNADANSIEDMSKCMTLLRKLHDAKVKVEHSFDLRERIDFYQSLCYQHGGTLFEDYQVVRRWMDELLQWTESEGNERLLTHIDSVADNFLILEDGTVKLIDWEYSGMSDPLLDIAMCAIYSYYSKEQADQLLLLYLGKEPTQKEQKLYYSYMALGGFLWCLWAVYKASLGKEFGEYTLIMYRYAKHYYKMFCNL